MNRDQLLLRLSAMLDEAARTAMFGTIEVEVREGAPILIRTVKTEKIQCRGNEPHAQTYRR